MVGFLVPNSTENSIMFSLISFLLFNLLSMQYICYIGLYIIRQSHSVEQKSLPIVKCISFDFIGVFILRNLAMTQTETKRSLMPTEETLGLNTHHHFSQVSESRPPQFIAAPILAQFHQGTDKLVSKSQCVNIGNIPGRDDRMLDFGVDAPLRFCVRHSKRSELEKYSLTQQLFCLFVLGCQVRFFSLRFNIVFRSCFMAILFYFISVYVYIMSTICSVFVFEWS